jgi:hypothetical protein
MNRACNLSTASSTLSSQPSQPGVKVKCAIIRRVRAFSLTAARVLNTCSCGRNQSSGTSEGEFDNSVTLVSLSMYNSLT